MLGGNAAERLIFGDTTTGSSNDIEKATDRARRMVTEYGMSDRLGPLSFGKRDELVFLGREIGEQRNYSDDVAKTIDEEVRAIIDRAYERAMDVLVTHRSKLEALAEKLVAEETVDCARLRGPVQRPPAEGEHPRPAAGASSPPARPTRRPRRAPAAEPDLTRQTHARPDGRATRLARPDSRRRIGAGPTTIGASVDDPSPGGPMAVSDDVVEAYLDANQEAPSGELRRLPADPERVGRTRPTRRTAGGPPTGSPTASGRSAWTTSRPRRPAVIRSSTPTGSAPRAPTVVVYGHYDVQPADPLDEWTSPPFEPAVVGSRILARGASDDKSNIAIFSSGRRGAPGAAAAGCRSTCASSSRARRSRRRTTSRRGWRRTVSASAATSRSSATSASSRATCRR